MKYYLVSYPNTILPVTASSEREAIALGYANGGKYPLEWITEVDESSQPCFVSYNSTWIASDTWVESPDTYQAC